MEGAVGNTRERQRRLPFARLSGEQWERLFDAAALATLILFLLYIGVDVYLFHGVDFRGYYAAARAVLEGGDPYDYRVVSKVLLRVTGEMGNNPYYYPPWFCLMTVPLALLPYQTARLVWIALNMVFYWVGARIALDVLGWPLRGWRRWLVVLSGAYLFFWLSMRPEQVGTFLFLMAVLSLWGYQRDMPWLAGAALALTLTKPNVAWLAAPCVGLYYLRHQRRAAWWALGLLALLLVVSTLILPGWYTHLTEPGFGAGLTQELDGPDRVKSDRLNTVLSDWLRTWQIRTDGAVYWTIWSLLAVGSALTLWLAWRNVADETYFTSLVWGVSLLLTFYALQYDYPPLLLALFWVYRAWPNAHAWRQWASGACLVLAFSVLLWERPIYDGYWILLGVLAALLLLNEDVWHWPRRKEAHVTPG
jgi:hypothetical protein